MKQNLKLLVKGRGIYKYCMTIIFILAFSAGLAAETGELEQMYAQLSKESARARGLAISILKDIKQLDKER